MRFEYHFLKALAAFLMGALVFLVLLELTLTLGAFWYKPAKIHSPQTAGSELRILCCGDSFTYGLGASDPNNSYPSQVERILRAHYNSDRISVLNAGNPGSNSLETVTVLKSNFEQRHYDVAVILTGLNNYWNLSGNRHLDNPGESQLSTQTRVFNLRIFRLAHLLYARFQTTYRRYFPSQNDSGDCWRLLQSERDRLNASTCFEQALQKNPDNLWARIGMGATHYALHEYRQCIERLSPLAAKEVQVPDIYLLLGMTSLKLGQIEDANHYLESLSAYPDTYSIAKALQGWIALADHDTAKADELFTMALEHDPYTFSALIGTGYRLLMTGKIEEASIQFEAIPDRSNWPTAILGLVFCEMAKDTPEQALRYSAELATTEFATDRLDSIRAWLARAMSERSSASAVALDSEAINSARTRPAEWETPLPESPSIELSKRYNEWFFLPFPDLPPSAFWLSSGYSETAIQTVVSDLIEIQAITEQRKTRLYIMTYPSSVGRPSLQEGIRGIARQRKMNLIDLESIFSEAVSHYGMKTFFPTDRHPNDDGYRLIATTIADRIVLDLGDDQ